MKSNTSAQKPTQEQIDAALAQLAEVQLEITNRSKVKEQLVKFLDD